MATEPAPSEKSPAAEFARQAQAPPAGFAAELWYFLRHNKKWWLTPIVVLLVLLSILIALGSTGVAPFIYTLF